MMAAWLPDELKASARDRMDAGTNSGVSACCAVIWNERATPSNSDTPRIRSREIQPSCVAPSNASAATSCNVMASATMWRRSWRSAMWPDTKASASAGTNWNRPTSPRFHALCVRSYICQPTATITIWLPMVPATRPAQNRMKEG